MKSTAEDDAALAVVLALEAKKRGEAKGFKMKLILRLLGLFLSFFHHFS